MHLNAPRIAPVAQDQWTAEQAELAAPMVSRGTMLNIFRTLLNHPDAMRGFMSWGSYVLSKKNTLPGREREIVVLRTGFLCGSGYEWTQHVPIGQRAGLSDAEIKAIKEGPNALIWSAADAALIRASDELHARQFVSDGTWEALKAHFSELQCMDVVFTAGQYTQVSMLLNTFGVQLDEGQVLDPQLKATSQKTSS
jgi:4-carboxymuconolactone decarboxylase